MNGKYGENDNKGLSLPPKGEKTRGAGLDNIIKISSNLQIPKNTPRVLY